MTSRKDIQFLINTLLFSIPGISLIERFVNQYRNYWVLIPRSVHRVKLVYRFRPFIFDIRFYGYFIVNIQDYETTKPGVLPTTFPVLIHRKNEELFTEHKKFIEPLERKLTEQNVQITLAPNGIALSIADEIKPLSETLEFIHQIISHLPIPLQ